MDYFSNTTKMLKKINFNGFWGFSFPLLFLNKSYLEIPQKKTQIFPYKWNSCWCLSKTMENFKHQFERGKIIIYKIKTTSHSDVDWIILFAKRESSAMLKIRNKITIFFYFNVNIKHIFYIIWALAWFHQIAIRSMLFVEHKWRN